MVSIHFAVQTLLAITIASFTQALPYGGAVALPVAQVHERRNIMHYVARASPTDLTKLHRDVPDPDYQASIDRGLLLAKEFVKPLANYNKKALYEELDKWVLRVKQLENSSNPELDYYGQVVERFKVIQITQEILDLINSKEAAERATHGTGFSQYLKDMYSLIGS